MTAYRIKIDDGATCTRVIKGGRYLLREGRGMGVAYWGSHDEAWAFGSRQDAQDELCRLPSYLREKARVC